MFTTKGETKQQINRMNDNFDMCNAVKFAGTQK